MNKDQAREAELIRRLKSGEYLSKSDRKEAIKLLKSKELIK